MAKVSLTTLWNDFYAWIARKDNPHAVTAAQAGAYTRTEIDTLLSGYVPAGIIPISTFGDPNVKEGGISMASRLGDYSVTISDSAMTIMLSGRQYRFKTNSFSFSIPPNSTQYLYVNIDATAGVNSVYLEALSSPREDTPTSFYVNTVQRGPESNNAVLVNFWSYICLIHTYRVSTAPIGSAIPASSGLPTETGTFKWG